MKGADNFARSLNSVAFAENYVAEQIRELTKLGVIS